MRAGTKPRDESEKELESTSGINDIEVIPSDHASHGTGDCNDIESGDVEQVGVTMPATDTPFTEVVGDKEHLFSDGNKLTKIKTKLLDGESLSDQLLQENRAGKKQCLEKSLEEEHHHQQPPPKVKRIEDSRRVPARDVTQANVGEEKGKPALSNITRKKLSEFRAPGFSGQGHGLENGEEVSNLNTNRPDENQDTSSTSQLKKKHDGRDEKILEKVLKKSSSENLLKSVTKMKFDLPKLNLDSIGDPFKQDDLEDLDI